MATQTTNYITGDAAFAVDQEGIIHLWNSAAEKMFGFPAKNVLGQQCWKLLSGQDTNNNRYCCERCPLREMALRHESVHSFPLLLNTASEGKKKINLSCLEVYDKPGNGLLLHICHSPDETQEYPQNNHSAPGPPESSRKGTLSSRELEVLALLAEGKATKEIASMMCISYATVRNHVQNTLHKLDVHNRLEAVVMGQRLNLV